MPSRELTSTATASGAIENALREDELGDGSREARLRCRKEWHVREREAAEIRAKALAACARKAEQEEAQRQAEAPKSEYVKEFTSSSQNSEFVRADVDALRQVVPAADFVSFVADTVMIRMASRNAFKEMKLRFRYMKGFPKDPVLIELEAPRLDQELVQKLQNAAHDRVAALAKEGPGACQAREAYEMISHFLATNKLATAFADIKQIQHLCSKTDCQLKHHWDRRGAVHIELREDRYFMDLRLSVDDEYPASPPQLEMLQHNLPAELAALYIVQAKQRASQLAEPPHVIGVGLDGGMARAGAGTGGGSKNARKAQARQTMSSAKLANSLVSRSSDMAAEVQRKQEQLLQSFSAKPSLWPVVNLLYADCLLPLVRDRCSVCDRHLLPADPAKLSLVKKPMAPERLYCGHMYHTRCLEEYIQHPPFDKGCRVCGKALSHHKFCTSQAILESRWSFRNARAREIADVAEFIA